jgi:hypothetical protein
MRDAAARLQHCSEGDVDLDVGASEHDGLNQETAALFDR